MTFKQMQDEILNRAGDTSTTTTTRVKEFINQMYRKMMNDVQFPGERRTGHIRTTSGQFAYALEPDVQRVESMQSYPNNQTIRREDWASFRVAYPKPTSTGTPSMWMHLGTYGVNRQPASLLRLVSDSASDTQNVTIYGLSDFRDVEETVTLTGATAILTSNEYTEVYRIKAASAAVGTITITSNSSAANNNLPVVATAGDVTIATIAAAATEPTNLHNPGSLVRLISSDASDDTSYTAVIEGYTIDDTNNFEGIPRRITRALNGTSEVETTARFTSIESVSVDTALNGNVEVRVDGPNSSTLRVVAVIPPGKRAMDYPMIGLYPIPTGDVITYSYYRKITDLVNNGDVPAFDEEAHDILMRWSESLFLDWMGDRRGITYLAADGRYRADIIEMRRILGLSSNRTIVQGRRGTRIASRSYPTAILDPATYSNRR